MIDRRRRRVLAALSVAVLGLGLGPGWAQSPTDQVIAQLQGQGFTVQSATRTLLGRVRVLAERNGQRREVVFDPRNGVVLRDFTERAGAADGRPTIWHSPNGDDDDGGGYDDDGGGDDDDDDDDDDDGDDGDDSDDGDDGDDSDDGGDDDNDDHDDDDD